MSTAPNTSLYVGDLDRDVTEAILFDIFREIGPVLSIRVCRDASTRKSLGYAYVNFQSPLDAEKALEQMNHTTINKKMCRIMWCRRDPSLRKSGNGNVFIKNLKPDIDNKALYDTFHQFGEILSCKVVTDEKNGESKGYGFVHFQDDDSADEAVLKVNGMLLNDQQVFVGKFERKDKKIQNLTETFTNVYFKHFDVNVDEAKLKAYFEAFGPMKSYTVQTSDDGIQKGVGYINFINHTDADRCCEEANDTEPEGIVQPGKRLRVVRHQKKSERDFNKKLVIKEKQQQLLKYTNLYVKNLDDSVTSESLRESFNEFGTIISCKVMAHSDTNVSKGFGFVCFQEDEAARKAMSTMNGRMLQGKPLYVTLAQKKDARKAQLELLYSSGGGRGMMNSSGGGGGGAAGGMMGQPNFMANPMMGGFGGQGGQAGFGGYNQMGPRPGMGQQMGGMPGMPGRAMGMAPQQMPRQRPQGFPSLQSGGGMHGMGMMGQRAPHVQGARPMGGMPGMPNARPGMPGMMPASGALSGGMPGMPGSNPLEVDTARLATMSKEAQKNMLGEKLYAKIKSTDHQNAAKITGMLLEMDNAEILNLLDSPNQLQQKVSEALNVLRNHTNV